MVVMDVVGWALVHSVWQGLLVAAGLWGVLRVVGPARPGVRYAAGLLALALMVALPVATYRQSVERWSGHRAWLVETADRVVRGRLAASGSAEAGEVTREIRRLHAAQWPEARGGVAAVAVRGRGPVRLLAWAWLATAALLLVRLAREGRRAERLGWGGAPDERWRAAVRGAADRLGVRHPPRVRVSDRVDAPALVGWLWPVVVVPPGAVGLPDEAVEAILAHELAHVQRHDYLVNRLQAVVEAVLFFNPAAHWISARVREERECCCDARAIRVVEGGAPRYLKALLALEEGRPTAGALALTGGPLLRRVRRIHETALERAPVADWPAAALLVAVAGTAAIAAETSRPDEAPFAAQIGAASLMLGDLDRMQVVIRVGGVAGAVSLPGSPPHSGGAPGARSSGSLCASGGRSA